MIFFENKRKNRKRPSGFTLMELLLGSAIMLLVILGALALYVRSNKVSVDQQQLAEVQHDVRSGMYFISRDIRMAGVGLSPDVSGYFLEGQDDFGPDFESIPYSGSDTIRLLGNFDDPLGLRIRQYLAGTASLYDYELENAPYVCPGFYVNKVYLIISTTSPGCYTYRFILDVPTCGPGAPQVTFQSVGQSKLNPPGGSIDTGCGEGCWDDAIITFGQIKFYWLDTTGIAGDYPGLADLDAEHGYLGIPNVLYLTTTGPGSDVMHMPLAMNIENLQFAYNGDFDGNGLLDGFQPWDNANWTILPNDDLATRQTKGDLISRITEVKMWILGKTHRPFVTVGRRVPANLDLYRRPAISNSPRAGQDDRHRRFLLESTSNVRNLSLTIYNTGAR